MGEIVFKTIVYIFIGSHLLAVVIYILFLLLSPLFMSWNKYKSPTGVGMDQDVISPIKFIISFGSTFAFIYLIYEYFK